MNLYLIYFDAQITRVFVPSERSGKILHIFMGVAQGTGEILTKFITS